MSIVSPSTRIQAQSKTKSQIQVKKLPPSNTGKTGKVNYADSMESEQSDPSYLHGSVGAKQTVSGRQAKFTRPNFEP